MLESDQNHTPVPGSSKPPSDVLRHPTPQKKPRKSQLILGLLVVFMLAVGLGLWFLWPAPKRPDSGLPLSVVNQVNGFKVYYFKQSPPFGYKLTTKSVTYQDGVLLFGLVNNVGNNLAVTEEAIPAGYNYSALSADMVYSTAYGQAYITSVDTQTTGALFTKDNTWILINAPNPIGQGDMETVLNDLAPFSQSGS